MREHDSQLSSPWFLLCCRYNKLATLEFDRDRKSMSVICSLAGDNNTSSKGGAPHTPRRSNRLASIMAPALSSNSNGNSAGNGLLVKGAAECVLQRCSQIMLADGSMVPLDSKTREAIQG